MESVDFRPVRILWKLVTQKKALNVDGRLHKVDYKLLDFITVWKHLTQK